MFKILVLMVGLSLTVSSQAAVNKNVKVKAADIAEIYVNDPVKNLLVVKDKNGRLLKLKVSPQQREEIVAAVEGYQVASTEGVAAPSTLTPLKAPAVEANTSIAKVNEPAKSPWGFHYLYLGTIGTQDLAGLEGELSNYNEVGIGYRFHPDWKFAVKPNFNVNYNLEQGNTKHSLGNVQTELNRGKFTNLAGFDLSTKARYYLPTGEGFRKNGTNGEGRLYLTATRTLSAAFDLKLETSLRYYLQSNRSSVQFDEFGRVLSTPKANSSWRSVNEAALTWNISKKLSIDQGFSLDHTLKYDDPGVGIADSGAKTVFGIYTSLNLGYLEPLSISLGIGQDHDISSDNTEKTGYSFYNPDESYYMLVGFIPFG